MYRDYTPAELEQRRKAPVKHHGASARTAIERGHELTGVAKVEQEQVEQVMAQQDGPAVLASWNYARVQAAANLYWNALSQAIEREDMPKIESYTRTFGWLAGRANRLLLQWQELERQLPDTVDYEQMLQSEE